MRSFNPVLPLWNTLSGTVNVEQNAAPKERKIEDYRPGYPQFSALLAAHEPFFVFRSFNKLRARVLLLKQDKLYMLEQKLEELDELEPCSLFLGKSRCDRNAERIALLSEIESCLSDYDSFLKGSHHSLSLGSARQEDVQSLQNWVDGTSSLAREETEYLYARRDLVKLAPPSDVATENLENWVEDKLIRFYPGFRASKGHSLSDDKNVYIYSGYLIKRLARAVLLILIALLLLVPVVICNFATRTSTRIAVIIGFTISYLIVLLQLTNSRTVELVMAGATYATVLTVFVSGTNGS